MAMHPLIQYEYGTRTGIMLVGRSGPAIGHFLIFWLLFHFLDPLSVFFPNAWSFRKRLLAYFSQKRLIGFPEPHIGKLASDVFSFGQDWFLVDVGALNAFFRGNRQNNVIGSGGCSRLQKKVDVLLVALPIKLAGMAMLTSLVNGVELSLEEFFAGWFLLRHR